MRSVRAALVVALASRASLAQHALVHVDPNVQVSRSRAREPHFEMQLAADPEHAERLMACSIVTREDQESLQSEVATYVTFDGGKTWAPTLVVGRGNEFASWDPTCAYGRGGVAYSVAESMDSSFDSWEQIDRSADGGRTWRPDPSRVKHAERTFLVVDHTGGPHDGMLYLYGAGDACLTGVRCANPEGVYLRASADGGRTITHQQLIPASGNNYPINYGPGAVLSDGTLVAPFKEWVDARQADGSTRTPVLEPRQERANAVMKVLRSKPGRANWPLETEVDSVADNFTEYRFNVAGLPVVAVDASGGPFRDRLYAVWEDMRSGRSEIVLSLSADSGKTWSRPRVLNDDARRARPDSGRDALQGMVAVNASGVVGVAWYDRRDHADNLGWTVRFRASLDGGETFGPSVKVSEVAYEPARFDPMPLMALRDLSGRGRWTQLGVHWFTFSGGDHAGFAADAAGAFHVLWVGNADGVPQLWTARVTADGVVQPNGSAELGRLRDVSADVRPRFLRPVLRRAARLVEADLELVNAGSDTVSGPLVVRVLDLVSESGVAEVLGADAGGSGEGAVWDFTRSLEGGRLVPGGHTAPKRIRIRLSEAAPLSAGLSPVSTLALFTTKVLAGRVSR